MATQLQASHDQAKCFGELFAQLSTLPPNSSHLPPRTINSAAHHNHASVGMRFEPYPPRPAAMNTYPGSASGYEGYPLHPGPLSHDTLAPLPRMLPSCGTHVLIDNNNLFHGAQLMDDGSTDRSRRVSIKEFGTLLAPFVGPDAVWKLVVGQMRSDRIAAEWRRHGFDINDTTNSRSDKLDPESVAHVSRLLQTKGVSGKFVLATGDGGVVFGTLTFPDLVEALVSNGWHVILLSWSKCMNCKYRELEKKWADRLQIVSLDPHRDLLSFSAGALTGGPGPAPGMMSMKGIPQPGMPPGGHMPVHGTCHLDCQLRFWGVGAVASRGPARNRAFMHRYHACFLFLVCPCSGIRWRLRQLAFCVTAWPPNVTSAVPAPLPALVPACPCVPSPSTSELRYACNAASTVTG